MKVFDSANFKRVRSILNLGVVVLIAAMAWAVYTSAGYHRLPLATVIPIWIVMVALLATAYLWERKTKNSGRSAGRSRRQKIEVSGYFLLCAGAATAAKLLLRPDAVQLYLAFYWTLVALTTVAALCLFLLRLHSNSARVKADVGLMALIAASGVASAPFAALHQDHQLLSSFPIVVAMILFVAPVLLRDAGFPPFNRSRQPSTS